MNNVYLNLIYILSQQSADLYFIVHTYIFLIWRSKVLFDVVQSKLKDCDVDTDFQSS